MKIWKNSEVDFLFLKDSKCRDLLLVLSHQDGSNVCH